MDKLPTSTAAARRARSRRSDPTASPISSVGKAFELYGRSYRGWRESADDAASPATHRRQAIRPLRPVCVKSQVRVRPHAHGAASDACRARRVGCAAGGCGEVAAVLTMRQAAMQCHSAARDKNAMAEN
jgi:hypothetical protein